MRYFSTKKIKEASQAISLRLFIVYVTMPIAYL